MVKYGPKLSKEDAYRQAENEIVAQSNSECGCECCINYYGFPEHRPDPSVGRSHILAGKCD